MEHGDEKLARNLLVLYLMRLIEVNPILRDKYQCPIQKSRLRTLINQSLCWQLQWCKNKRPNHGMLTLFVDHSCEQATGVSAPFHVADSFLGSIPEASDSPPLSAHGPFQLGAASITKSLAGRTVTASSVPYQAASGRPMGLSPPSSAVHTLKHQGRPPMNPTLVTQTEDSQHMLKRSRSLWISEEAPKIPTNAASIPNAADMNAPVADIPTPSGDVLNMSNVKPKISDELQKSKIWKLKEIKEPSELHTFWLPRSLPAVMVARLIYIKSGRSIFSLCSGGVHKLWERKQDEYKLTAEANSAAPPQLWHPNTDISLTNDVRITDLEKVVPCLALSTDECYAVSASGEKISLFDLINFKLIKKFMYPPTAATCLAFYPPNNDLIAIGMEDSVIRIYDPLTYQVICECKGHQKRVTGIVISNILNVMVSSGADAQVTLVD